MNNSTNICPESFFDSLQKPLLFQGLSDSSIQKILDQSSLRSYDSGSTLVQQGDNASHIYLIVEGCLRTLRTNRDGGEATIHMLEAGDTCMESVIFMGGPSPIEVRTTKNSQLLLISSHFVRQFIMEDAEFAANLLKIVTQHYKTSIHQIEAMSTKTPVQSVGYYFLQKHIEQGSNNMTFELPFKKSVIANHLGMTPETFSRALAQIKKMGIEIAGETIKLHEAYSLCHFCDTDSAHSCTLANKEECPQCPLHGDASH